MLNILVVLFELSAKVTLDKVHPHYLFHPKSRVNVAQQTRLKLTLDDTTKFAETLGIHIAISVSYLIKRNMKSVVRLLSVILIISGLASIFLSKFFANFFL
jgi:hypothetical protein